MDVSYETWMKDAKLNLRENFCEYVGKKRLISIKILAQTIKQEEDEKNIYYKEGSAYLDFPLNQTYILPNFRENQKELENNSNSRLYHKQPKLQNHGNLPYQLCISRGILCTERDVIQRAHESAEGILVPQIFIPSKSLSRGLARRRLDRAKEINSLVRDAK